MSSRLILGVTGFPATGKTEIAKHLKDEHDFTVFEGSALLKAAASTANRLLLTRADYAAFFREQQQRLGMSWIADMMLASGDARVLHCGLRAKADFQQVKQVGGSVLGLICPPEICIARIDKTNPKNPTTIEEYAVHQALEESDDAYGTHTGWCVANADYQIDTSRPLGIVLSQVDEVVAELETH